MEWIATTAEPDAGSRMQGLALRIGFCVAVFALAAAVRIYAALQGGLWRDEAQFLYVAQMPYIGEMLAFLRDHESHPPLYYLLTRLWSDAAGWSDLAELIPPVFAGSATAPALYWLGRRWFSARAGAVAAILWAVSPQAIHSAIYVRPYPFVSLACLLSAHFLAELLEGRRPFAAAIGLAGATLAALLSHNWAWMFWGGEVAAVCVWAGLAFIGALPAITGRSWLAWFSAQGVIACGYAFWLMSLLKQTAHAGYDASQVTFAGFLEALVPLATLSNAALAGFALMFVAGAACLRRFDRGWVRSPGDEGSQFARETKGFAIFGTAALAAATAAALLSRRTNLLVPHSLMAIAPCLVLCFAQAVATLSERRPLVWAGFICGGLAVHGAYTDIKTHWRKSNAREAAAMVRAQARPEDLTLVLPQWDASSFYWYHGGIERGLHYPTKEFSGPIFYDDSKVRLLDQGVFDGFLADLRQAHADGRRIWAVYEQAGPGRPRSISAQALAAEKWVKYSEVGEWRAEAIVALLNELYGPPVFTGFPKMRRGANPDSEALRVMLFAPSANEDVSTSRRRLDESD